MERRKQILSEKQWFRMSYLECVTVSMMVIPYLALAFAGQRHFYALAAGVAAAGLFGVLIYAAACRMPDGLIGAMYAHLGWFAPVLSAVFAVRYLLRAAAAAVFFSVIVQKYLLGSYSVWWILIPFSVISVYGASKTMSGRGRMFELLFGWMVVPLILIVVFSVSNIDPGTVGELVPTVGNTSVWKGACAVWLALSPLELLLYSTPCVRDREKTGIVRLLLWIFFTVLFAYFFIVSILGYAWTKSAPEAAFNVMEAAAFPGGAVARLDYPVMAFWVIGVFALTSGYLYAAKEHVAALCAVRTYRGRRLTLAALLVGCVCASYAMQMQIEESDSGQNGMEIAETDGVQNRTEAAETDGVQNRTEAAETDDGQRRTAGAISVDFSANAKRQDSLEHRDYVRVMRVEEADRQYRFVFEIADLSDYQGEHSVGKTEYEVLADSLEAASAAYEAEWERQLDFGHIEKIQTPDNGEMFHRLLLELGDYPGISKSVTVEVEDEDEKYILRQMIKAAYEREL